MYEIAKDFVDEQICMRFIAKSDQASPYLKCVVDIRPDVLELAATSMKLREALFKENNPEAANETLLKDVLGTRKQVDELTEEQMLSIQFKDFSESTSSADETVILATANYSLGLIRRLRPDDNETFWLTDEEYFLRCISLLGELRTEPTAVITVMKVYDQLHDISWHTSDDYPKHYEYLRRMVELYIEYAEQDIARKPIDLAVEVGVEESPACENTDLTRLDVIYLHTVATYIDLYAENGYPEPAFVVCLHRMMQQQLPKIAVFDVETAWHWISTLCEVSVYFMEGERFAEAKNYILTAEYVLANFRDRELAGSGRQSELNYMTARLDFMHCVIARFWGIYGIELLNASYERMPSFAGMYDKAETKEDEAGLQFANKPMSPLLFAGVEDSATDSARKMRTEVSGLRDAKEVFLTVLSNVRVATASCFSLEKNIEIYSSITIELSKAYKYLACFEREDNKMKLYKKQVEIVSDLQSAHVTHPFSQAKSAEAIERRRECFGKIGLNAALARYSVLDATFDDNMLQTLIDTKVLSSPPQEVVKTIEIIESALHVFCR